MKRRTQAGLVTDIPCGRDAAGTARFVIPALLNPPLFGGVARRGQRAVHIILRQHDADFFDREHGLLRSCDEDTFGLIGLDDFLELFRGLRSDRFRFRGVAPVKMYGEIAEVRGYVRGIHYLGFTCGRFTWLNTQAEAPAVTW